MKLYVRPGVCKVRPDPVYSFAETGAARVLRLPEMLGSEVS